MLGPSAGVRAVLDGPEPRERYGVIMWGVHGVREGSAKRSAGNCMVYEFVQPAHRAGAHGTVLQGIYTPIWATSRGLPWLTAWASLSGAGHPQALQATVDTGQASLPGSR